MPPSTLPSPLLPAALPLLHLTLCCARWHWQRVVQGRNVMPSSAGSDSCSDVPAASMAAAEAFQAATKLSAPGVGRSSRWPVLAAAAAAGQCTAVHNPTGTLE